MQASERKWFPQLTKKDLLEILESCPQQIWPPRPTRQDDATLRRIIKNASLNGYHGAQVREAVGRAVVRKRHQRRH